VYNNPSVIRKLYSNVSEFALGFSLVCAAYLLLKENNVTVSKRLRKLTITTRLKKLYVTVVTRGQSLLYEGDINITGLTRIDFYPLRKCVITTKGNVAVLNSNQKLILETIERKRVRGRG